MKRQAMDEVQKAVAEAEQKAFEMIATERAKMEKTLAEAKRKAQEDAIMVINEQEDSSEVRSHAALVIVLKMTNAQITMTSAVHYSAFYVFAFVLLDQNHSFSKSR